MSNMFVDGGDILVGDGDALAQRQHVQILIRDIGVQRQRHGLLGEARGLHLFVGGTQIVLRQAPDIQLIAGVEVQAERLLHCRSSAGLAAAAGIGVTGLAIRPAETAPNARWWIALRLHHMRRGHRQIPVAGLGLANQRRQLVTMEALPPVGLRPDRRAIA